MSEHMSISAFPVLPPQDTAGGVAAGYPYPEAGMTLRDYFAAAALSGGLEQGVEDNVGTGDPYREAWFQPSGKIAARAYKIADAMMAERRKGTT